MYTNSHHDDHDEDDSSDHQLEMQKMWLRNFHAKIKNAIASASSASSRRFFSLQSKDLNLFKEIASGFYRCVVDEILSSPNDKNESSSPHKGEKRDYDYFSVFPLQDKNSSSSSDNNNTNQVKSTYVNFVWICKIIFDFATLAALPTKSSTNSASCCEITVISSPNETAMTIFEFFYDFFLMFTSLLTLFCSRRCTENDNCGNEDDEEQVGSNDPDIYKNHHTLVLATMQTLHALIVSLATISTTYSPSENITNRSISNVHFDLVVIDWIISILLREVESLVNGQDNVNSSCSESSSMAIRQSELKLCAKILSAFAIDGILSQKILIDGLLRSAGDGENSNNALLAKFTAACTHFLEIFSTVSSSSRITSNNEQEIILLDKNLADSIALVMEIILREHQQNQEEPEVELPQQIQNHDSHNSSCEDPTPNYERHHNRHSLSPGQLLLSQTVASLLFQGNGNGTESPRSRIGHGNRHSSTAASSPSPSASSSSPAFSAENLLQKVFKDALLMLPGGQHLDGVDSRNHRELLDEDYNKKSIPRRDVQNVFSRVHSQTEAILNDLAYQANTEKMRGETLEQVLEKIVKNQLKELIVGKEKEKQHQNQDSKKSSPWKDQVSGLLGGFLKREVDEQNGNDDENENENLIHLLKTRRNLQQSNTAHEAGKSSLLTQSASFLASPSAKRAWEEMERKKHEQQVRTQELQQREMERAWLLSQQQKQERQFDGDIGYQNQNEQVRDSYHHQSSSSRTFPQDASFDSSISSQLLHRNNFAGEHTRAPSPNTSSFVSSRNYQNDNINPHRHVISNDNNISLNRITNTHSGNNNNNNNSNGNSARVALLEAQLRDMQERFQQEKHQWQRHSDEQQKQIHEILNQRSQAHFGLGHLKF